MLTPNPQDIQSLNPAYHIVWSAVQLELAEQRLYDMMGRISQHMAEANHLDAIWDIYSGMGNFANELHLAIVQLRKAAIAINEAGIKPEKIFDAWFNWSETEDTNNVRLWDYEVF